MYNPKLCYFPGAPTVVALNATPVAYPGSPLHLNVEFCANPPAHAARWLHGDRVFTPGNQYGSTVLAYSVKVCRIIREHLDYLLVFNIYLSSYRIYLLPTARRLASHMSACTNVFLAHSTL